MAEEEYVKDWLKEPVEPKKESTNWIDEELKNKGVMGNFEKLPTLKMEEGSVVIIQIDFSKPFERWTDNSKEKTKVKAIIPVLHNGAKKNFWLNTANPLYTAILEKHKATGQDIFKILQTGTQDNTKYIFVKEE